MKMLRKTLSLLLTICILMSMACISYADEVTLPDKLVDLDISEYVQEKGNAASGKKSGIKNIGTSKTADFMWVSHEDNYQLTTKKNMISQTGTTEYLDFTMGSVQMTYTDRCSRRKIYDENFATSANTISFWVDCEGDSSASPVFRTFFGYAEDYGSESTNPSLVLYQSPSTNHWNTTDGDAGDIFDVSAYGKWKHVVIVNPKYDNGKKTMLVYVNGKKVADKELAIPSGKNESNLNNDRTGFYFGGKPVCLSTTAASMPSHAKYADIEVYDGVLTEAQISKIYNDNLEKFTPYVFDITTAPVLVDLDFSGVTKSTVPGASGIINNGEGSGAEMDIYSAATVSITGETLLDKTDLSPKKNIVRMVNSEPRLAHSVKQEHHFSISDETWYDKDITISFWVDSNKGFGNDNNTQYATLAELSVSYDESETPGFQYARLGQVHFDNMTTFNWAPGNVDPSSYWNADDCRDWAHVIMTVSKPKDGVKTVNYYVNGKSKYTKNLVIPSGAEITDVTLSFGGQKVGSSSYLAADLSLADVKIYEGIFSEENAKELYTLENEVYANIAKAYINFRKGDNSSSIYHPTENSNIIVRCERITRDCKVIVAAYDEEENLLNAKEQNIYANGTKQEITVNLPAGTKVVKAFAWNASDLTPIQRVTAMK